MRLEVSNLLERLLLAKDLNTSMESEAIFLFLQAT